MLGEPSRQWTMGPELPGARIATDRANGNKVRQS